MDSHDHIQPYEPFEYNTLTDDDQFRTIILEPGQYQDPIGCQLQVHQITSPPDYEALSYVWGDPVRSSPLILNGKKFQITKTLDLALRQLRLPQTARVLWIDQLCIAQDDVDERSQQVQLMKLVYSRAKRVLVWLGPEKEMLTSSVKTLIEKIDRVWFHEIGTDRFPSNDQLSEQGLPHREASCWTALQRMLYNPYFLRIWVVQECKVASELLLLWGTEEISWTSFGHTIIWIFLNSAFIPDTALAFSGVERGSQLNFDALILLSMSNMGTSSLSDNVDWLTLLGMTRHRNATDHRDKLFALLGLFDENGPSLKSDYRKGSAQVFSELVSHMIPRMQTLDLLSYVDVRSAANSPLWAPRWEMHDSTAKPMHLNLTYKAGGTIAPKIGESPTWRILVLEGLLLDRIDDITLPLDMTMSPNVHIGISDAWELAMSKKLNIERAYPEMQELVIPFIWALIAGQQMQLGQHTVSKPADLTVLLDFAAYQVNSIMLYMSKVTRDTNLQCMRSILQLASRARQAFLLLKPNHNSRSKALSDETKAWFEDFLHLAHPQKHDIANCAWKSFERVGIDVSRSTCFQTNLLSAGHARRFFVSSQGYLGIGPSIMEPGDKLCVLFGGSTPYVIRPTSDPNEFLFLGECYTYGLMDGEAIKLWEEGRIQSQWFHLR